MRKPIIILSIVLSAVFANAQVYCPPVCCGGGSQSYLTVTLMGMGNLTPPRGWIEIAAHLFSTTQDGCESFIEYSVKRDCSNLRTGPRMPGSGKNWSCIVICGADCPEHIACNGCPGLFSHGCGDFSYYFELAGRGDFIVKYNGVEVFRQHFDFGGGPDYFIMNFTDIRFLNKDFTPILSNDIFDAMESVAIRVDADYTGNEPASAIGVILRSDISQDTLVVDLSLEDDRWNTATYSGRLEAGFFARIIGDPDEVLPPYTEAEISAEPVPIDCPGEPTALPPVDILPIANFQIFVEEIGFSSDYDLCKDGPGSEPAEEPILDPVWIRDTKNEPVAYLRNSLPNMDLKLISDRIPYHDFEYSLMGTGGEDQGQYITGVYDGHFYSNGVSFVHNIGPRDGTFPDYVGIIDPLTYNWWVKKVPGPDPNAFRFANTSTHKIFLTYADPTPLLEDINVLALEKMCHYAQGKKDPAVIAESGVDSLYREGWEYDTEHSVNIDPLDLIRQRTGQCADYANLLTYLYRSIGIDANSVTIYNGCIDDGKNWMLLWKYTYLPNEYQCLLSKQLTSCDNQNKIWPFGYHATSFAAGKLCDAVFGIFDTRANYEAWWLYYLQPPERHPDDPPGWCHDEPPTHEPSFYDWPDFFPFYTFLPLDYKIDFIDFWHPYEP